MSGKRTSRRSTLDVRVNNQERGERGSVRALINGLRLQRRSSLGLQGRVSERLGLLKGQGLLWCWYVRMMQGGSVAYRHALPALFRDRSGIDTTRAFVRWVTSPAASTRRSCRLQTPWELLGRLVTAPTTRTGAMAIVTASSGICLTTDPHLEWASSIHSLLAPSHGV